VSIDNDVRQVLEICKGDVMAALLRGPTPNRPRANRLRANHRHAPECGTRPC
jgi:hypothetical protein